jgi:hypothetical protein
MTTLKEVLAGVAYDEDDYVMSFVQTLDEGNTTPFMNHCVDRLSVCFDTIYVIELEAKFKNEEQLWNLMLSRYAPQVDHQGRVEFLRVLSSMPPSLSSFMHILMWGAQGFASPMLRNESNELVTAYLKERQLKYLSELGSILSLRAQKENRSNNNLKDLLRVRQKEWTQKLTTYQQTRTEQWKNTVMDPPPVGKKLLLQIIKLFYCIVIPSFQFRGVKPDRVRVGVEAIEIPPSEPVISIKYDRPLVPIPVETETDTTSDIPSLIRKDKDLYKIFQLKTFFPNLYASKDPLLITTRKDLELACRVMRYFILRAVQNAHKPFEFYTNLWAGIATCKGVIPNLRQCVALEQNADEFTGGAGVAEAKSNTFDDSFDDVIESKEEGASKPISVNQMVKFYQPSPRETPSPKSKPSPSGSGSSGSPSVVVPLPPNWINFRLGSPNLLSVKYDEGINACTPRDSDVDSKICYELRDAYKRADLSPEEHTRARYKFAKRCVDSPCWDKGHCEAMRRSLSSSPTPPSPEVSALVDAYCTKANDNEAMYGPYYSPLSTNRSPILDAMITNVPLFNDRFNTNNKKKDAKRKKKLTSMYLDFAQSGEETPNRTKLLDLLGSPRRTSP